MLTALEGTFTAWTQAGHLTGAEHYALRQTLREQARSVDELRVEGKLTAAAQAAAVLHNQLTACAPARPRAADEFDEFLADLAAQGT